MLSMLTMAIYSRQRSVYTVRRTRTAKVSKQVKRTIGYFNNSLASCVIFTARCYAQRGYAVRLSVCPSVRDVEVCFSHRLKYFENNVTASARVDPDMGDLVQRKHPQN